MKKSLQAFFFLELYTGGIFFTRVILLPDMIKATTTHVITHSQKSSNALF